MFAEKIKTLNQFLNLSSPGLNDLNQAIKIMI